MNGKKIKLDLLNGRTKQELGHSYAQYEDFYFKQRKIEY